MHIREYAPNSLCFERPENSGHVYFHLSSIPKNITPFSSVVCILNVRPAQLIQRPMATLRNTHRICNHRAQTHSAHVLRSMRSMPTASRAHKDICRAIYGLFRTGIFSVCALFTLVPLSDVPKPRNILTKNTHSLNLVHFCGCLCVVSCLHATNLLRPTIQFQIVCVLNCLCSGPS